MIKVSEKITEYYYNPTDKISAYDPTYFGPDSLVLRSITESRSILNQRAISIRLGILEMEIQSHQSTDDRSKNEKRNRSHKSKISILLGGGFTQERSEGRLGL